MISYLYTKLETMTCSLFLTRLFSTPTKVSQHLSMVKTLLFLYLHALFLSIHQVEKMTAFYAFVNRALNICSDPVSFHNEIQYLKAIALDRSYNLLIVDKAFLQLKNPCLSHPSYFHSNVKIIRSFS